MRHFCCFCLCQALVCYGTASFEFFVEFCRIPFLGLNNSLRNVRGDFNNFRILSTCVVSMMTGKDCVFRSLT